MNKKYLLLSSLLALNSLRAGGFCSKETTKEQPQKRVPRTHETAAVAPKVDQELWKLGYQSMKAKQIEVPTKRVEAGLLGANGDTKEFLPVRDDKGVLQEFNLVKATKDKKPFYNFLSESKTDMVVALALNKMDYVSKFYITYERQTEDNNVDLLTINLCDSNNNIVHKLFIEYAQECFSSSREFFHVQCRNGLYSTSLFGSVLELKPGTIPKLLEKAGLTKVIMKEYGEHQVFGIGQVPYIELISSASSDIETTVLGLKGLRLFSTYVTDGSYCYSTRYTLDFTGVSSEKTAKGVVISGLVSLVAGATKKLPVKEIKALFIANHIGRFWAKLGSIPENKNDDHAPDNASNASSRSIGSAINENMIGGYEMDDHRTIATVTLKDFADSKKSRR